MEPIISKSARSSRASSRVSPVLPMHTPRSDTPLSYGDLHLLDLEDGKMGFSKEKQNVFVLQPEASALLSMDEYQYWLEDLFSGDVSKIDCVLKNADPFERSRLVNGLFVFQDKRVMYTTFASVFVKAHMEMYVHSQKKLRGKDGKYHLVCMTPPQAALMSGQVEVFTMLVKWGADITKKGICDFNVLHFLAISCVTKCGEGKDLVPVFKMLRNFILEQPNLGLTVLKQLLMAEDVSGFRPVELASRVGALDMANAILNTEDVYRFTKTVTGYQNIARYDITDYTIHGARHSLSPLKMLMVLPYERLAKLKAPGVVDTTAIIKWAEKLISTHKWGLRAWMIYRLLYVVTFVIMFQDILIYSFHDMMETKMFDKYMDTMNATNSSSTPMARDEFQMACPQKMITQLDKATLNWILMPLVALRLTTTILAHSFDMVAHQAAERNIFKRIMADEKLLKPVAGCMFYIMCDFAHIMSAFGVMMAVNFGSLTSFAMKAVLFSLIAVASVCNVWSCLYFLRLDRRIGHFVVTFQEMIGGMAHFMVIQLLILFSFAVTFFAIIGSQCLHSDFETLWSSMYATFITMLNMVSFTEQVKIDTPEGLVIVILHIIYVLVVAVLLLNFLIALMSNTVSQVSEFKNVVNRLHRMYMSITIEERFAFIIRRTSLRNKAYIYEDGRVYFEETYARECSKS